MTWCWPWPSAAGMRRGCPVRLSVANHHLGTTWPVLSVAILSRRGEALMVAMKAFVGLDLGQAQDFTALAVMTRPRLTGNERRDARTPPYDVPHLHRFPLGTPYCHRRLRHRSAAC